MKKIKLSCQLLLLSMVVTFFSCSSDENPDPIPEEPQKSSAKSILSFKFSSLSPEVVGTIMESDKKVNAIVPNGTNVTALIPTIQLSEKATISPATSVAQDFTNPVNYTVTAEDGSTQSYQVTVSIDPTVNFTLSPALSTEIEQDGIVIINGTNFGSHANNKVLVVNKSDNTKTFEYPALAGSTDEILFIRVAEDIPLGEYNLKVFIGQQSKFMNETFTVVVHAPEIISLDKTTVIRGENIIITGKYFQNTGNQVKLGKTGTSVNLQIVSESSTSIEAKIPDSTSPDDYTLSVKSNNKTSYYNSDYVTVQNSPTAPLITSVNKTSLQRGETLIIYGENLKKTLVATNINFVPFISGTTQLKSGIANAEGTEVSYTFPEDFPTGTYIISVEVDGEYSDEYNEVIQITP